MKITCKKQERKFILGHVYHCTDYIADPETLYIYAASPETAGANVFINLKGGSWIGTDRPKANHMVDVTDQVELIWNR
jgi:hypothetical protein